MRHSKKLAVGQSYVISRQSAKSYISHVETDEEDDDDEAFVRLSTLKKSLIANRFHRYGDCPQFQQSPEDSIFCCDCNETKDAHILSQSFARDMCPTNAYGVLEFVGGNRLTRAKYIRLADKTSKGKLLKLFQEDWKLTKWPKLLVSIVGGGGASFSLSKNLDASVRQGLRKVALSTHAWFMTGGTDNGAVKFVGNVLEGHKYKDVKIIGVLPWGVVAGRETLVSDSENLGGYAPKYPPIRTRRHTGIRRREFYLNRNHSHFILVDTGKVGVVDGELEFRSQMECMIISEQIKQFRKSLTLHARRNSDQFNKKFIPAVQIVINGGSRVIETVAHTLQVEETDCIIMPVLVVAGSGRAADLLALACKLTNDDNNFNQLAGSYEYVLMNRIEALYPGESHEENLRTLGFLMKCMKKKRHITIYDAQQDNSRDLDEAILTALIRMNEEDDNEFDTPSLDLYTVAQLNLTLLWNRADIAQKEIFMKLHLTRHEPWLEDLMMLALLEDKRSFVELLLENGFDLKFFNYEKLAKLYCENYKPEKSILRAFIKINKSIVKEEKPIASDDDDIQTTAFDRRHSYDYAPINHLNLECVQRAFISLSGIDLTPYYWKTGITAQEKLYYPLNELFLWAVLCNKHDLALCFWRRGSDVLAKSLIAHKLYLQMATHYKSNHTNIEEEVLDELKQNAKEFSQLSLELLDHCSCVDKQATKQLLSQELKHWGNQTCMSLAESAEFEEFISHPSCQDLVLEKWRGSLVFYGRRASHKVIIGLFFLPIIFCYEFQHQCKPSKRKNKERKMFTIMAFLFRLAIEKIRLFFGAPITKFWISVFSFLVFLGMFCHLLLIQSFPALPSAIEWCVAGFIVNLTIEELRQIFQSRGMLFHQKLHVWWAQGWNKVDMFAILLFYSGFAMRMSRDHSLTEGGRVVYALDLMIWILRLLDVFSVNRKLGPYVVMIRKMLFDVLYFIIILSVFLLSYGIARYAILLPSEKLSEHGIEQILVIPYFQIFGEMFLEVQTQEQNKETIFQTRMTNSYSEAVVLLIMAIYLILTNILLVNLLIAVFNNTYSRVQLNSKRVWKWQWYCLVEEYSTRPSLVPPFIFIYYVIEFSRSVYRVLCKRIIPSMKLQEFDLQKRRYSIIHTDATFSLMKFEEECQSNYIALKQASLHDTEKKFEEIKTRGTQLEEIMVATSLRLAILDKKIGKLTKSSQSDALRLARIEKLIQKSFPDMARSISVSTPVTSRRKAAVMGTEASSSRTTSPRSPKVFNMKPLLLNDFSTSTPSLSLRLRTDGSFDEQKHVLSRSLCYPYSNVHRFTFEDIYVDWKVDYKDYKPTHHTSLAVKVNLSWADSEDVLAKDGIKFNMVDGEVDRTSFLGSYEIFDRLPRNPMGRTGLTGRGCLGRYGPNHIVEPVITRYQRRKDGSTYHECYDVLVVQKDSGDYELPSGSVAVGKNLPHLLERLFSANTLKEIGLVKDKYSLPALQNMRKVFDETSKRTRIHEGYLDDERNTDNAWVETSAINYHDDTGALNKFFICERLVKLLHLHWIELNEHSSLPEHQISYLRTVAMNKNIAFENL